MAGVFTLLGGIASNPAIKAMLRLASVGPAPSVAESRASSTSTPSARHSRSSRADGYTTPARRTASRSHATSVSRSAAHRSTLNPESALRGGQRPGGGDGDSSSVPSTSDVRLLTRCCVTTSRAHVVCCMDAQTISNLKRVLASVRSAKAPAGSSTPSSRRTSALCCTTSSRCIEPSQPYVCLPSLPLHPYLLTMIAVGFSHHHYNPHIHTHPRAPPQCVVSRRGPGPVRASVWIQSDGEERCNQWMWWISLLLIIHSVCGCDGLRLGIGFRDVCGHIAEYFRPLTRTR